LGDAADPVYDPSPNVREVNMSKAIIVSSLGIGLGVVIVFFLFWSVSRYLKKRISSDSSGQHVSSLPKESWEEKRQHPRVAVSWKASVNTSEGNIDGQLKDISLGGAFFVCEKPKALKEKFCIIINVPNEVPLNLNAEMVWSNFNVPDDKVILGGMGIRFVENTEEDRKHLRAAMENIITEKKAQA